MAAMNFPITINPVLTAIAIGYNNKAMIADSVMPRVQTPHNFEYWKYGVADMFTIPDLRVDRTSRPNQVENTATRVAATVFDYALDGPVPMADKLFAEGSGFDPEARTAMQVTNLVELAREVRVSTATFNVNNYATANKATLTGTGQWSDPASNPVAAMLAVMDGMLVRPTIGVTSREVATQLQLNPNVVSMFYKNTGTKGVVPLSFIAQILDLRAIYVGEGWINTAAPGQTPTLARAWGKKFALLAQDPLADNNFGSTWGYTAQWGTRVAGRIGDPDMGMRGGFRIRVGESVNEIVTAPDLGYLFTAAVA